MLRITPNSGEQTLYLTLQDGARDYTYTHYLFKLTNQATKQAFYFVAVVDFDNPRYTAVRVRTDQDDTNNVLLTKPGFYVYEVYVQSSATNLDPDEATAKVEQGLLQATDEPITTAPATNPGAWFAYT
jgi:hypothetical protein